MDKFNRICCNSVKNFRKLSILFDKNKQNPYYENKNLHKLIRDVYTFKISFKYLKSTSPNLNLFNNLHNQLKYDLYYPLNTRKIYVSETTQLKKIIKIHFLNEGLVLLNIFLIMSFVFKPSFQNHNYKTECSHFELFKVMKLRNFNLSPTLSGKLFPVKNINYVTLSDILKKKVEDKKFIGLFIKILKIYDLKQDTFIKNIGSLQKSLILSTLYKIYLYEFDIFMYSTNLKLQYSMNKVDKKLTGSSLLYFRCRNNLIIRSENQQYLIFFYIKILQFLLNKFKLKTSNLSFGVSFNLLHLNIKTKFEPAAKNKKYVVLLNLCRRKIINLLYINKFCTKIGVPRLNTSLLTLNYLAIEKVYNKIWDQVKCYSFVDNRNILILVRKILQHSLRLTIRRKFKSRLKYKFKEVFIS